MCDRTVKGLAKFKWNAVSIHGDKDQWERTRALEQFTKGVCVCVCAQTHSHSHTYVCVYIYTLTLSLPLLLPH